MLARNPVAGMGFIVSYNGLDFTCIAKSASNEIGKLRRAKYCFLKRWDTTD
jgi:hypothetical protein